MTDIPQNRNQEWLDQYFTKKNIDPAIFVSSYETMNQQQMSEFFHMQKKDVGYALKLLGVDTTTAKTAKIVANTIQSAATKRQSEIDTLAEIVHKATTDEQLCQHFRDFGIKDAQEHFGIDAVRYLELVYPDLKASHSSVIKHNKGLRFVVSQEARVKELLEQGFSLNYIANQLSQPVSIVKEALEQLGLVYTGESQIRKSERGYTAASKRVFEPKPKSIKKLVQIDEPMNNIIEPSIFELLESLEIPFSVQDRDVLGNGKEVDFYVPSKRLAIEVNPTHTHNVDYGFLKKHAPRGKNYHADKFKAAVDNDVKLIQLYSWDLKDPQWSNVTIPFLKFQILGADKVLYARNVNILEASSRTERKLVKDFLETYHEQGFTPARVSYRMYDKDELVGVATFSPTSGKEWELKRLCFAPGVQVRYGLSKFVSRFFKDHLDSSSLMTYSRNDMGTGHGYESSGFTLVGDTGPNLIYVNESNPHDLYSWQIGTSWSSKQGVIAKNFGSKKRTKQEIDELILNDLPHRFDSRRGYVRVYGSGSRKWVIKNPH